MTRQLKGAIGGWRARRFRARCEKRTRGRPHVFVFTDSRGIDVNRQPKTDNPLGSFVADIMERYATTIHLVPEKHTTIADFFRYFSRYPAAAFDAVVLQAFVVDVAPRPKSAVISDLYRLKKRAYDRIFGEEAMARHLQGDLGVPYQGEVTHNAFSIQMARDHLVPLLEKLPNLVFIGANPAVKGWRGNYWRDRPANMEVISDSASAICDAIPEHSIDLSDWDDEMVKRYTCDNIHFSPEGMRWLSNRILAKLDDLLDPTP